MIIAKNDSHPFFSTNQMSLERTISSRSESIPLRRKLIHDIIYDSHRIDNIYRRHANNTIAITITITITNTNTNTNTITITIANPKSTQYIHKTRRRYRQTETCKSSNLLLLNDTGMVAYLQNVWIRIILEWIRGWWRWCSQDAQIWLAVLVVVVVVVIVVIITMKVFEFPIKCSIPDSIIALLSMSNSFGVSFDSPWSTLGGCCIVVCVNVCIRNSISISINMVVSTNDIVCKTIQWLRPPFTIMINIILLYMWIKAYRNDSLLFLFLLISMLFL